MSENLPHIDAVIDELHSEPPADFVARRSAHVARFKKSGDKAGASRIASLRKPTVTAWLVNCLARRDESALAELFELGEKLERAQQRGEGHRLRELSSARSASIRTLTHRAVTIGAELGTDVGENAAREISNTLSAALADPEIRKRVRAGTTVVAETYSGFGPALLSLVPDQLENRDDPIEDEQADVDEAERARLRAELDSAEGDLDIARIAAEEAAAQAERSDAETRSAEEEVERIEADLRQAERRLAAAREHRETSRGETRATAQDFEAACARVAEARAALEPPT